jgi:hypothetical protein
MLLKRYNGCSGEGSTCLRRAIIENLEEEQEVLGNDSEQRLVGLRHIRKVVEEPV